MATKKKPGKKLGRFFPCPANGDTHPEMIACEAKETIDAKGKTRHSFFCPVCNTRVFLNNWEPEHSFRTIVWAESQNLHCMGITQRRKDELLAALGLQRMTQAHQPAMPPQLPFGQFPHPQAGYHPVPRKPSKK